MCGVSQVDCSDSCKPAWPVFPNAHDWSSLAVQKMLLLADVHIFFGCNNIHGIAIKEISIDGFIRKESVSSS